MKIQIPRLLLQVLVPLGFAFPALAQGSDGCSTPTAISGEGSFAFNNTSATTGTQGQNEALCDQFGTMGITRDVWFAWTATADGYATLTLCGGASFDSKVAAYAGSGCPSSSALACNDDSCSVQSVIGFDVTLGSVYTVQLGCFPGAGGGSGSFQITIGSGPPACGDSTGPDVIVGDVSDVLNTTPVGGIDAIALGTTSCNVGTALLNWFANTNDHPVIRQNAYRYKVVDGAGRFEQIGMSWLKHGFTSLQGSLCCTCQPGGDGSHLGVGCSDPYGASLNGSQGGLGPNWQVNAHTGVFTYPPAGGTGGSGNVYRRCQMLLSDLEVTGGGTRFFGECQYVTKDDATAGNQNNNVSWREMTCSGNSGNYTMALIDQTHREDPAIRAWAAIDPAVNVVDLQISGDGLVILGTRATDLGTDHWRYEYAVYNMNADRNVGSISIPVPAGVTVTNIGFHDVAYHDGDGPTNSNFASTDWAASQVGNTITWSTQTPTQNASANAIRWGTQYNFRFDADTPPESGTITLGMWKPGTPTSVAGTGDVPSAGDGVASFCFGDGSGFPCPCANNGIAGHGCANSSNANGGLLTSTGSPSLSADTLVVTGTDMRFSSLCVLFQGLEAGPATAGDGIRCFGGSLNRLYSRDVVSGSATMPTGADPSISAQSAAKGDPLSAGSVRVLHLYYRDQNPSSFCPPPSGSNFNTTNGLRVTWSP